MKVTKIFQWDAAHFLSLPYASQCCNLHGHTYKIEVEIEGPVNEDGMVFDFVKFKELLAQANFDHQLINNIDWFKDLNPTAENLVKFIHHYITLHWPWPTLHISRIRVWETPNSWAEDTWERK